MEKLSLENAFQQLNYSASRIANAYHDAARRLGLSDSELDILYTLCTHAPGCPQSAIYKETGATRSTINSAIRKMEKAELLYLTPGQGRGTRVYLTEKGRALTETTVRRLIALEKVIYESWTPEEREMLERLNRSFAEKLKKEVQRL